MPPLIWASVPLVAVRLKPSETAKVCMITTTPIRPISIAIMTSIKVKPRARVVRARLGMRVMALARIDVHDGHVLALHRLVGHLPVDGDRDQRAGHGDGCGA